MLEMTDKYILVNRIPKVVSDINEWGEFMDNGDRRVGRYEKDGIVVSTVFLGLDHNFSNGGIPILFETLVFGGELDGEMVRYTTWKEAEMGHEAMVRRVKLRVED